MSSKVLALWGGLIITILVFVSYIGITKKEELKFIESKNLVKAAVKEYISKEGVNIPLEITTKELIEKDYLNEITVDGKNCNAIIKVTKKYILYNYDIKFECINSVEGTF